MAPRDGPFGLPPGARCIESAVGVGGGVEGQQRSAVRR